MSRVAGLLVLSILAAACSEEDAPPVAAPSYVSSFGKWGIDPGEFKFPTRIEVGPDSLLYVGDRGNARIQVFTSDGVFQREWPGAGNNLVVAPDGTVCTAPALNPELSGLDVYEGFRRYTRTGEALDNWNQVQLVGGLQFDAHGNTYVYGRRVRDPNEQHPHYEGQYFWKFNSQNELVKQWGYPGPRDTTGWSGGSMEWNARGNLLVLGSLGDTPVLFEFTPEGEALTPRSLPVNVRQDDDIAVDRKGSIHLTSWANQRMYILDSWGKLLLEWRVGEEPFGAPTGVTVDAAGFLYVVDFRRYRVVKYGLDP